MAAFSASARGTLWAAAFGFVVVLLDISVVNVALDALQREFSTDVAGLQWVVNAYTLAFAALLLTSGALGDRFGARRLYLSGLAVFTLASAACGLAGSLPVMVGARLIQGMGAALLVPNSLVMVQRAFPDSQARSRAVGWWGALGGAALAAGPVLGGVLVAHAGWRSVFLINLPVGLIGICLTLRHAAPSGGGHRRGLDWSGQVAAMVALAATTMTLIEAGQLGWAHGVVRGGALLALVSLTAFLWIEARSTSPMLPLNLFRNHTFSIVSLAGVAVNFAYYGLIFVFSLFFQMQQHLSPQQTGLAFLPMTLVLVALNVVAGRLITRLGPRLLMFMGLALAGSGYLLLMRVSIGGHYALLIVPMLMAASGVALVVPTMTNATLASVDRSRAGIASSVLNCARQVGGMLGVALFGSLIGDGAPDAFMHGMHISIGMSAGALLLASVLCWSGMRPGPLHPLRASGEAVKPE